MPAIERESPIPLYYQLKQLLAAHIARGEWQPGDMLPTEEQLQEEYDLSRTTVRQALRELELEGLISRHRGRGTFVSEPKLKHSPDPGFSLTAYLLKQGMQPGWRVLSSEWIDATKEIEKRLESKPGTSIYRLRRLRLANNEPIGYHIAHVVPDVAQLIDEDQLDQGGSLDYLRKSGLLNGGYADRSIESILASQEIGEILGVRPGSPILMIKRRVFNKSGEPVEDFQALYRGDRFQYRVGQRPVE